MKKFLNAVNYLKNNQKYLKSNPLSNDEERMKTIQ